MQPGYEIGSKLNFLTKFVYSKSHEKQGKAKKEMSNFDKVFLSDAYIHSSNYYIPEDRDHLQRKLNNLVDDVHEKHEEILKENEE